MNAASAPRDRRTDARLLCIRADADADDRSPSPPSFREGTAADLPDLLQPGDLLVVNDAATLPASLRGTAPQGQPIELRLLGAPPPSPPEDASGGEEWPAVLFGAGDWRTPTEHRPPPPPLQVGDVLRWGSDRDRIAPPLSAQITRVSPVSPRLIHVRFHQRGAAFLTALYAHGRPIQYAYLQQDLPLWSVQTVYGARPWAAEMPSAGRPLSWDTLLSLRRRGVELCWLTHAAGISSTGDRTLDAALPLPERYDIPDTTAQAIARARARGGRIVAVGTTVVRALEGAAQRAGREGAARGTVRAGDGVTDLRIDATTQLDVVDAIISGMHGPEESHFQLLSAFAPPHLLRAAWDYACAHGFLCHEFGDLCLVFSARRTNAVQQPAPSAQVGG